MTGMTEQELVLDVQGISRSFSGKAALKGRAFPGAQGVPHGHSRLCGGPGRPRPLRMIAGLDRPDAGELLLAGQNVAGWEPKDRNVAMIFDNLALYPNKNGYNNIASPLVIRGESPEVIEAKVLEMAKTLQITHILGRLPKTMSGG